MREKRDNISDEDVIKVLEDGYKKAKTRAEEKMKEVRKIIGISL